MLPAADQLDQIIIYSTVWCPDCKSDKAFLEYTLRMCREPLKGQREARSAHYFRQSRRPEELAADFLKRQAGEQIQLDSYPHNQRAVILGVFLHRAQRICRATDHRIIQRIQPGDNHLWQLP